MSNIRLLDEATYSKIAAGEVIERPAGVLKELLENAVDAGATLISIEIEGSGKTLLRVTDNGHGMDAEDLHLSLARHATSKIAAFDDLNHLQTFGFRGEALYSVAAVCRLSITSCTAGGEGHRMDCAAGHVSAQMPAPAIVGTTVEIRDLFYNTPARLKFLKSDAYERAVLLKVIEESALANLSVAYRVRVNGRDVYNLPTQTGPFEEAARTRARAILGAQVADSLVFKEHDSLGLKLLITPADKLAPVRDYQYVFVNRRPIDSKTVQQALYKAYQNARGKDRHPAFLVYMTLPPADFDVNIHPQKRDIRFIDEGRVFGFLMVRAGEAIFGAARPVEASVSTPMQTPFGTPSPLPQITLPTQAQPAAEALFYPQNTSASTQNIFGPKQTFTARDSEDPVPYGPAHAMLSTPAQTQRSPLPQEQNPQWYQGPYHYLGQLQKSYLLFENPHGLVLIDQHAAQERVLYEQYLSATEARQVKAQELIFPIHVDLAPSNIEALLSWADWLKTAGFEVAPFSPHTVLVKTMPYLIRFKEDQMKEFIISLAQVVGDPSKSTEGLKRKMVAMLACKKAVKAHDLLSPAEAEALLENMKNCQDGMHCPHGRPCVAQLSMKEMHKLFGR